MVNQALTDLLQERMAYQLYKGSLLTTGYLQIMTYDDWLHEDPARRSVGVGSYVWTRNGPLDELTTYPLEFFLNEAELSLNSGNLKITEAWIGLNLKILSLHVSCLCCGSILVSYTRGGCVAGSNPFTVMTNFFVTEFAEFSENI